MKFKGMSFLTLSDYMLRHQKIVETSEFPNLARRLSARKTFKQIILAQRPLLSLLGSTGIRKKIISNLIFDTIYHLAKIGNSENFVFRKFEFFGSFKPFESFPLFA